MSETRVYRIAEWRRKLMYVSLASTFLLIPILIFSCIAAWLKPSWVESGSLLSITALTLVALSTLCDWIAYSPVGSCPAQETCSLWKHQVLWSLALLLGVVWFSMGFYFLFLTEKSDDLIMLGIFGFIAMSIPGRWYQRNSKWNTAGGTIYRFVRPPHQIEFIDGKGVRQYVT